MEAMTQAQSAMQQRDFKSARAHFERAVALIEEQQQRPSAAAAGTELDDALLRAHLTLAELVWQAGSKAASWCGAGLKPRVGPRVSHRRSIAH